jgi:glycosyltransferase involved in cell wall biosynthesis
MISVVVPVHNEEAVIERFLSVLLDGPRADELEVILVANACTDRTVELASRRPGVRVIEIEEASKRAALIAGDAIATHFPRAYVDADLEVSAQALLAAAEAMDRTGALAGAPALKLDLADRPWAVRSYYRVWCSLSWNVVAPIGSGVYLLSREGHARLGDFPVFYNDDQYIHDMLRADERVCAADHSFLVRPPRTFWGLVVRRARTLEGDAEIARLIGGPGPGHTSGPGPLEIIRRDPRRTLDVAMFVLVGLLAHARRRRERIRGVYWAREHTSRDLAIDGR